MEKNQQPNKAGLVEKNPSRSISIDTTKFDSMIVKAATGKD
jgi:hypothetical protein